MAFVSTSHASTLSSFTQHFPSSNTSFIRQSVKFSIASSPLFNSNKSVLNHMSMSQTSITTDVSEARGTLPNVVVPEPLPNLYVYDHCPFCVRVRHVLGTKNIKYNLIWLMNDDATTPKSLVGKKMVPIFQPTGASGDSVPESLDICKLVDSDPTFGMVNSILPENDRKDISQVMDDIAMPLRRLTRVRFSRALLPEFTFESARNAYIINHPLKDPADYEENFQRSSEWISQVQKGVDQLNDLVYSKEYITKGGFSYDDVVIFAKLRALTIIKGLQIPSKLKEYIEWQAARCEIPLYYNYAI